MLGESQPCFTLINCPNDGENPSEMAMRKDFESTKVPLKIAALKKLIEMQLNGERFPSLLMVIIRFVMPCDDHMIKKLLHIYWEIVPKFGADGKLLHEMILVCDAYRKDLLHSNEFVRGSTLRFLCKLKEPELIEPLMPAIRDCLSYRHPYVKRNAVLAIYTIYKNFEHLVPDAPELIEQFLEVEQNASCKRNAFIMLTAVDQARALRYLDSCLEQVGSFSDILQLVVVELLHKVCRQDASLRGKYLRSVRSLMESSSSAVRYDAAATLVAMSSAPRAVTDAAQCYADLILKESDNNIKLIVMDRLIDLKNNPVHLPVLQGLVMDIVRVLAAPDLQVRKKGLQLVMDLVTSKNVHEVVASLKKEVAKTNSSDDFDKSTEYRQLLIRALHLCGVKFPDVAGVIVPQLMEFLSDTNADSAMDVILFVREAFERLPALRAEMLQKIFEALSLIKASKVLRAVFWIIGEFSLTKEDMLTAVAHVRAAVGPLPIVDTELRERAQDDADAAKLDEADTQPKVVTKTRITVDGTYATESVYTSAKGAPAKLAKPTLRQLFLDGDFFLGCSVVVALTKLSLRFAELSGVDARAVNQMYAEAMLVAASIAHVGKSALPATPIDEDSHDRIMLCLRVMADPAPAVKAVFLAQCHASFATMLAALQAQTASAADAAKAQKKVAVQADDLIEFRALRPRDDAATDTDDFELSVSRATGHDALPLGNGSADARGQSKLSKVFQLSGFSDPVYAEAYIHVNQYDILLDVIAVNQTPDTLQGLTLELATLGDLKLTEKPTAHTLGPHDFCNIKANVKVSSTETGIIFGNIVYDVSGAASDRNCVILNDIHIDIMDYITPAPCTEADFRAMWAEFEWENKVAVRTNLPTLRAYLDHLLKNTNMRCLTPASALDGDCEFLAANLYAKSVFGEDALANLSIEKSADGSVSGHIRIRSKTQGIALSLGDKITLNQKNDHQ